MLDRGLSGAIAVMISAVVPLIKAQPSAGVDTSRLQFEVNQFGATGTDLVRHTAAVQPAIDTCAAATVAAQSCRLVGRPRSASSVCAVMWNFILSAAPC